jgi:hypothetical protein
MHSPSGSYLKRSLSLAILSIVRECPSWHTLVDHVQHPTFLIVSPEPFQSQPQSLRNSAVVLNLNALLIVDRGRTCADTILLGLRRRWRWRRKLSNIDEQILVRRQMIRLSQARED